MRVRYEGKLFEVRFSHQRPARVKPVKFPKGTRLEIHLGDKVMRLDLEAAFNAHAGLVGHTGRPSNGVTTATLGVVSEDGVNTPTGLKKFLPIMWAQASCSVQDQFSKAEGRRLALYRLLEMVRVKDEELEKELYSKIWGCSI